MSVTAIASISNPTDKAKPKSRTAERFSKNVSTGPENSKTANTYPNNGAKLWPPISALGLVVWLEGWRKRMTTLEPKPAARAA